MARGCLFSLAELRYQYPSELIPKGASPTTYLRERVEAGIKVRFPDGLSDVLRALIEKELSLIREQEYEYFFFLPFMTLFNSPNRAKSSIKAGVRQLTLLCVIA